MCMLFLVCFIVDGVGCSLCGQCNCTFWAIRVSVGNCGCAVCVCVYAGRMLRLFGVFLVGKRPACIVQLFCCCVGRSVVCCCGCWAIMLSIAQAGDDLVSIGWVICFHSVGNVLPLCGWLVGVV